METYRGLVHKPGKVLKIGDDYRLVGNGVYTARTGMGLMEATSWCRRSPRFRTIEAEVAS